MTTHLGLDPGLASGWAIGDFTPKQPLRIVDSGAVPNGVQGFIEWWPAISSAYKIDRVVCEKFIIDGTITGTWSSQIEGALLALYGGPVTWQPRSDKAALLPTEPARRGWFKAAGVTLTSSHSLDAATHLLVERKRAKHLPTLAAYWPKP